MELLNQYQRLEIALKLGRGRNKKPRKVGMQAEEWLMVIRLEKVKSILRLMLRKPKL